MKYHIKGFHVCLVLMLLFVIPSVSLQASENTWTFSQITEEPTFTPTIPPTDVPTEEPTFTPTIPPTDVPTEEPTFTPTVPPTDVPTEEPIFTPTVSPTDVPTEEPTFTPTVPPTNTPTMLPTATPTSTPLGSISGTVIDGLTNLPFVDVSVKLFSHDYYVFYGEVCTDSNGQYNLDMLDDGLYMIEINWDSVNCTYNEHLMVFQEVEISEVENNVVLYHTLYDYVVYSGQVTDENGTPIPDLPLQFIDGDDTFTICTDENGFYVLHYSVIESMVLLVNSASIDSLCRPYEYLSTEYVYIDLLENRYEDHQLAGIVYLSGFLISGTAYQGDGITPQEGIYIVADTSIGQYGTCSDSNGQWEIALRDPNTTSQVYVNHDSTICGYGVSEIDNSYVLTYYNSAGNTTNSANAEAIIFDGNHFDTTGVNFIAVPAGLIKGNLYTTGTNLHNGTVRVGIANYSVMVCSDVIDGSYTLYGVPFDTPVIISKGSGCEDAVPTTYYDGVANSGTGLIAEVQPVTVTALNPVAYSIDISDANNYSINGTIEGNIHIDNVLQADIPIKLTFDSNQVVYLCTDAQGEYSYPLLNTGYNDYTSLEIVLNTDNISTGLNPACAYKPLILSRTLTATLPNLIVYRSYQLYVSAGNANGTGTITGNVYDEISSLPVNVLSVQLLEVDTETLVGSVCTDSNGYYEFDEIDDGVYRLVFNNEGNLGCPANASYYLKQSNQLGIYGGTQILNADDLARRIIISGHITVWGSGIPLPNVPVSLSDATTFNHQLLETTCTDENGYYQFEAHTNIVYFIDVNTDISNVLCQPHSSGGGGFRLGKLLMNTVFNRSIYIYTP